MATKKKVEKEEVKDTLDFLDVLKKFRSGEMIDFLDILDLSIGIGELAFILSEIEIEIALLDYKGLSPVEYEIEVQKIKFFNGLLQCTSLEVKEEDAILENIDFDFESFVLNASAEARKLYEMVDNLRRKKELLVVQQLTEEFQHMPTPEEIESLKNNIEKMFEGKSSEELKYINDILAFNDPTLNSLKEMLTTPLDLNVEKENDEHGAKGDILAKGEKI